MHPTENILKATMSELKEMIDVNTIVGTPFVSPGGCTIIPISRLSFGFVSGGGEYGQPGHSHEEVKFQFGGGTASGVSINPVAFMVADNDNIKLLTVSHRNALDKIMENLPHMVSELKNMACSGNCCCGEYDEENKNGGQNAGDGE